MSSQRSESRLPLRHLEYHTCYGCEGHGAQRIRRKHIKIMRRQGKKECRESS